MSLVMSAAAILIGSVPHTRIQKRIQYLPVFKHVRSHPAFANEACLFQHSHRSRIVSEWLRKNALQIKRLERPARKFSYSVRHNSASPKWFAQPIAQFRRFLVNIVAET